MYIVVRLFVFCWFFVMGGVSVFPTKRGAGVHVVVNYSFSPVEGRLCGM